jgi:hypothetical protein
VKSSLMGQGIEYKTPLVQIRGVFLCEEVAIPVSAVTGTIKQYEWEGTELPIGDTNTDGDVWLII